MSFHKLILIALYIIIVSTGCNTGTNNTQREPLVQTEIIEPTLVIWTYTDEFITELDAFEQMHSCKIDYEIIDVDNFERTIKSRIDSGEKPDILIGDYDAIMGDILASYIKPLNDFSQEYGIEQVLNKGMLQDSYDVSGNIRGLSYHMTPVVVFYRRSLAQKVLGTDSSTDITKHFASMEAIYNLGLQLDKSEVGLVPDPYALRHFAPISQASDNDSLTEDITLWRSYLTRLNKIKQEELTPFYIEWSNKWFAGMQEDVFSYVLPNWGLSQILLMAAQESSGDWGIVQGPSTRQWGGTWISMTQDGQEQVLAELFLHYILLDQEHLLEWLGDSYQVSSHLQVQKRQTYTEGNEFLGGQDYHQTLRHIMDMGLVPVSKNRKLEDLTMQYINDEFHTVDEALAALEE